ncbi:MAG: MEDS domain-containing protein [Sphingomonadales bacterium]
MTTEETQQDVELLNIKQAAKLLNVSEISLRRWTDSGILSCLRVGARRERRFRREDLLAFPEQHPADRHTGNGDGEAVGHKQIHLDGVPIEYGSHLCTFYESDLGRVKTSVPFLVDGLRAGDICFLIAADDAQEQILTQLKSVYGPLDAAFDKGLLRVCEGMASGKEMLDFFEREFVMATQKGNQSLRVLGDMSWFLCNGMDIDDLADFEVKYNYSLAHRFPVVSLCQYDARKFSGQGVLNALKCHEDTFKYPMSGFLGV